MSDRREEIEDALDVAVERTRSAEEEFLDKEVGTPEAVDAAVVVEHRAEDVDELAAAERRRAEAEERRRSS